MISHDSSTVAPQLLITEEPPIHSGTTDPQRLPASVRPWAMLTPTHQNVLVNVHAICEQIALGDAIKTAHTELNAAQVADYIADELAGVCAVKGEKITQAFRTVARATFCDPGRMVRMARANDLNEFCEAIPTHLRAVCGCSMIKFVPMPKVEEDREIVLDPWKVSALRIANALANVHTLGVAIRVS